MLALLTVTLWCQVPPASAWHEATDDIIRLQRLYDGIHILDGTYVMNVGQLQVNITNWGLIGSRFTEISTYSDAPSAQWPAGSSVEYMWAAGLWVGGRLHGDMRVSTGQFEAELRPGSDLRDTIYEANKGKVLRPPGDDVIRGRRLGEEGADDDHDGLVDEDYLNGRDDDGDGSIDEDFGQIGDQMLVCTIWDNTLLAQEAYTDHDPLNIKIIQRTVGWETESIDDFVGFDLEITNIGAEEIRDVYIGMLLDGEIGHRNDYGAGQDDLPGYFEGFVRADNDVFYNVAVAYMYDAAPEDPKPGWIGIAILDHPVDRFHGMAPFTPGIRSFKTFNSLRPFGNGGDPGSDNERYLSLSSNQRDGNHIDREPGDYRVLVSCGPFVELAPDATIAFRAALVVGDGRDDLLKNCAEAMRVCSGASFDLDNDSSTGRGGRETRVYAEDFGDWDDPNNPIFTMNYHYWDRSCAAFSLPNIEEDDFTLDEDGFRHYIYVNADVCLECAALAGGWCTSSNGLIGHWDCYLNYGYGARKGVCTGSRGRESRVPWYWGEKAPAPPGMRVWAADRRVHVFWDDAAEYAVDPELGLVDFESHRIWRADNWERQPGSSLANGPPLESWQMIAEYDLKNQFRIYVPSEDGGYEEQFMDFGRNTGFDGIVYRPRCLDDPRFAGLGEAMAAFVANDRQGRFTEMPPLRDSNGQAIGGREQFLPWETYHDVIDTFFTTTGRESNPETGQVAKRAVVYYEHVDRGLHNGFLYFYSATATDHLLDLSGDDPVITGSGLIGSPQISFVHAIPGFDSWTPEQYAEFGTNIYVYPNPATRNSLAEFQQMHPNRDDPSGVRVAFANLPAAHNIIEIFTLAGDHLATVEHDGTGGYGQASWNLITRNGQRIVSGIYLYTVNSDDHRFKRFTGKFAVIW